MQAINHFRDRKLHNEIYSSVHPDEVELYALDDKVASEIHRSPVAHPATTKPSRWYGRYFNNGWRGQMIRVTVLSTSLWVLITVIYIVLCTTFSIHDGSGTLLTSTCSLVQRANTGIHVVLNVFASLMLSASNFAMEALCCPDREVIDAAHARKRGLRIGGQSIGNFRFVSKVRLVLFMLLMLTSAPLHLFFNAVFFTSSRNYQYSVAVVKPSFFNDSAWTSSPENIAPSNFAALGGYAHHGDFENADNLTLIALLNDGRSANASFEFETLNPHDCMFSYAKGFVQNASDVIVVTDLVSNVSSPLIWTRYPERSVSDDRENTNQDPYNWICHDALQDKVISDAREHDYCTIGLADKLADNINQWTVYDGRVQYCLSRYRENHCSLFFNLWLMLAVVFCGVVKTIVMIWICVRYSKTQDLRTFGDAVKSFLEQEDEATQNLCLVPSKAFVKTGLQPYDPQVCTDAPQRWWLSAGLKQFCTTLVVTILYIVLFGIALYFAIDGASGGAFDFDLGQINILALARVTADNVGSSEIVPNLLVANIPQVAFSFLYLLHNNCWSRIYMGVEFDKYRKKPMGLRVSEVRKGEQRGSRFFDLPIHWALSLIATSAALHWLTSQALFLVRIDGIDSRGEVDRQDQLTRLGYNCRAITALVCVLLVVVIVTVCIGWFRKFEIGLGEVGNSLIISAACHPPSNWNVNKDMATKKVSWGDVTIERDCQIDGVRHASFADVPPKDLQRGAYYA